MTYVTCTNDRLGLELVCADCVDVDRDIYVKRDEVRNLRGQARQVRLFQQLDLHLWGNSIGDTAFYDPDTRSLVAYKGRRYLMVGARAGGIDGLSRWATGRKGSGGLKGTWRDAEDGELGGNPNAQGSVDCVGGIDLSTPPNGSTFAYFWIVASIRYGDGRQLHDLVMVRGPESFLHRTLAYWRLWINRSESSLNVRGLSFLRRASWPCCGRFSRQRC